jgi:hypothetical protein
MTLELVLTTRSRIVEKLHNRAHASLDRYKGPLRCCFAISQLIVYHHEVFVRHPGSRFVRCFQLRCQYLYHQSGRLCHLIACERTRQVRQCTSIERGNLRSGHCKSSFDDFVHIFTHQRARSNQAIKSDVESLGAVLDNGTKDMKVICSFAHVVLKT